MRWLLLLVAVVLAAPAETQPGSMSLRVVEERLPYPDDRPVIIHILVTNTGDPSLSYESGGPGPYPKAQDFSVDLIDSDLKQLRSTLVNGQYQNGSMWETAIDPGTTVDIPAVMPNPGRGRWTLTVETTDCWWPNARSEAVHLEVAADPDLSRLYDARFVNRLRSNDQFFGVLLADETVGGLAGLLDEFRETNHDPLFTSESFAEAVAVLDGDDVQAVVGTAWALAHVHRRQWPQGTAEILDRCARRWCVGTEAPGDLAWSLAEIARRVRDADR